MVHIFKRYYTYLKSRDIMFRMVSSILLCFCPRGENAYILLVFGWIWWIALGSKVKWVHCEWIPWRESGRLSTKSTETTSSMQLQWISLTECYSAVVTILVEYGACWDRPNDMVWPVVRADDSRRYCTITKANSRRFIWREPKEPTCFLSDIFKGESFHVDSFTLHQFGDEWWQVFCLCTYMLARANLHVV
jgi:hypothetical protein